MNGQLLEELFSEHAKSINTASTMAGVRADGYIFLSVDNNVEMKVALQERGLRYIEYSDRARHLRLDAPLIAYLTQAERGPITVDVPVSPASPEVPPQLATLAMRAFPIADNGQTMVSVATAEEILNYSFHGHVGLEDLLGVARDVLLLAEAAHELDCQGPHDAPYPYPWTFPPPRKRLTDVMMLKYKVCRACLEKMDAMGFPMAPPIPKGWE